MNQNDVLTEKEPEELDLCGKVCPLTFVHTKLRLEKLNSGDYLKVKYDFPSAIKNVPKSCKRQELAEVISINKIDEEKNIWEIILKKI
jgi:tRNA 2-thiouridine synthesizing protein A